MKLIQKVIGKSIFSISLPDRKESILWTIDDGEFCYTHLFHFGVVQGKSAQGVQLVIGPMLFSLAWNVRNQHESDGGDQCQINTTHAIESLRT